MGITLGELKANKRKVTIEFDDIKFDVTYRPGAITPVSATEPRSETWLIDTLAKLLDSWDVFEDDAQTVRVPVNAATLSSEAFGVPRLRLMYDIIIDDSFLPKVRPAS